MSVTRKTVAQKVFSFIHKYILYFFMTAATFLLVAVIALQDQEIQALKSSIHSNRNLIEQYKNAYVSKSQQTDIMIRASHIEISKNISGINNAFNARIDILDSAIKPEKKKRMLVVKIRDAIGENTTTKNSIRNLTNIAIATIEYSYQYNIPIPRILAQIKVESDFNIKAESKAGAQGLMQIMPATMKYIELAEGKRLNPWNIYHNIRAGCFYMAEQMLEFDGNYDYALGAYNWGPNNMKRFNAGQTSKMPEETEKYIPSINKWAKVFEKYGLE
jgi:hypothetical protein